MIPLTTAAGIPGMEMGALLDLMAQFMFALLRIGGFVVAAPFFGGRTIPLPIRLVFSSALAVAVMDLAPMPDPTLLASVNIVPHIITELAIGVSAGLVMSLVFASAAIAGDRIASTAGLGFAMQMDPQAGGQTPVVSQIFGLFLIMIFLVTDGHLVAIRILLESYVDVPPLSAPPLYQIIEAGFSAAVEMFVLAVQLMLPAIIVLLVVNMLIGVLTRSAPQLNIFSFGFPLTLLITIVIFYLTAPIMAVAFEYVVNQGLEALRSMMELI